MKVAELIGILEDYDEDMEVIFQPQNSIYGEKMYLKDEGGIVAFWGNNFKCLVFEGHQVGRVADYDEVSEWEDDEEEE